MTNNRRPLSLTAANTLGTLGYMSLMMQWAWSLIIVFYPAMTNRNSFLFPQNLPSAPPPVALDIPAHPIITAVVAGVTIAILALAVVVLFRMPKAVGKTGSKLTRATSEAIIPALIHHKKISKQRHITLSYQSTLIIKLLACIAPLAFLLFAPAITAMPSLVIWAVALFCATCTSLLFIVQILVVYFFDIDKSRVW